MKQKINKLNVRSRKQLLLANAIIRTKNFRQSRSKTSEGKRVFNNELRTIKSRAKKLKVNIKVKTLPEPFRRRK